MSPSLPVDWFFAQTAYQFSDAQLLEQALTHRSLGGRNNERLEFLGDAVLDATISLRLYERRPDASEGALSRLRSFLVRDKALAAVAQELDIGRHLKLGQGERQSGGFRRESILGDSLEAVLGAVFLDGGYAAAEKVIDVLYANRYDDLPDDDDLKDPKTRLQEWLQARSHELPIYTVVNVSGKAHQQNFVVSCVIAELELELEGRGSSRRKAEQAAAAAALIEISGSK